MCLGNCCHVDHACVPCEVYPWSLLGFAYTCAWQCLLPPELINKNIQIRSINVETNSCQDEHPWAAIFCIWLVFNFFLAPWHFRIINYQCIKMTTQIWFYQNKHTSEGSFEMLLIVSSPLLTVLLPARFSLSCNRYGHDTYLVLFTS